MSVSLAFDFELSIWNRKVNKIISVLSVRWSVHFKFFTNLQKIVLKQLFIPILVFFSAYALFEFISLTVEFCEMKLKQLFFSTECYICYFCSDLTASCLLQQLITMGKTSITWTFCFGFCCCCFFLSFLLTVPKTPPANVSGRSGRRHELVIAWEVRDFSD